MRSRAARRAPWARLLFALGAVTLLAVAALLLRGAFTEQEPLHAGNATVSMVNAIGASDHASPSLHAYRPLAVMRARGVALAMLAIATLAAACVSRRLRLIRSERRRILRVGGLPQGRAPPPLGIA